MLSRKVLPLRNSEIFACETVQIDVNIDGLSLSKSSNFKVWPILGALVNEPNTSPFIIGVYVGDSNPKCIDNYLEDLINEIQELFDIGVKGTSQQILKPLVVRTYIYVMLRPEPFWWEVKVSAAKPDVINVNRFL